ncbi:ribonuclease VapC [Ochrobactrum anthropi]|uniref:type II toxin-antitoxin system VapC family toxin n=1 Tax=Brucella anthropi TaxID=529 RepID=UPI0015F81A5F|nr:type II toxin-antitoxin system VapC family toxin [Brucella anthropi]MBA8862760.1 ribonuclease VapC [Brucella anthropi]
MSFVDASALVAIINEEPGFEEIEKRLSEEKKRLYVSPLVRFETIIAVARIAMDAAPGKVDRSVMIAETRVVVDAVIEALEAKEISIDGKVGNLAVDAAIQYGKVAGHKARLNFGDCFAYAAAKAYRLPLVYKGDDFAQTDLA